MLVGGMAHGMLHGRSQEAGTANAPALCVLGPPWRRSARIFEVPWAGLPFIFIKYLLAAPHVRARHARATTLEGDSFSINVTHLY